MSAPKTFRFLATQTELADSPFPGDARYQQVFSEDGSVEAISGGMGVVYHAKDTLLGVDVAIKRMQRHLLGDTAAEQRFIHEARAQIRLTHPNIVRMYTINEDCHGPWMVLEWIEGQSLQTLSEAGVRPSREEAVQWVLQIADALQYAHGMGFVHRDVKPGNILLRTAIRQPLLTDFGLVADRRATRGASMISLPGLVLGTLDFMAPEQACGSADLDHRADQWALGAVLGWLLTGKTMRVLRQENLPQNLREVVLQATEEHPQDRFEDLGQFAEALKSAAVEKSTKAARGHPGSVAQLHTTGHTSPLNPGIPDVVSASGVPGKCWYCEHRNVDDAEFCVACGKSLRDICLNTQCRQPIGVWQRFCAKCGVDQQKQREDRQKRVNDRCDVIRRKLEEKRYDLAIAELRQLELENTTDRQQQLLLGPAVGLRAEAERVRSEAQEVIAAAREAGAACNYAEALQILGQIPKPLWPAEAVNWQRTAEELQELARQIPRHAEQGAFAEFKAGFKRLQELKPGPWSDRGLLEKCLAAMIRKSRKLQASDQLEQAMALLEVVPPADRTQAFSDQMDTLILERVNRLIRQLEQAGEELHWNGVIGALTRLDRLQPGRWPREVHISRWLQVWQEKALALSKQRLPGEVYTLLQRVPEAERTPGMHKLLTSISKYSAEIAREAASIARSGDYAAAVLCLEQLPENLRPATYAEYVERQRNGRALPFIKQRHQPWRRRSAILVALAGAYWIGSVMVGRAGKEILPGIEGSAPALLRAPFDEQSAKAGQTAVASAFRRSEEWTNSVGMKFRIIPAGTFLMGSPDQGGDERPQHSITIKKPYYIGIHEVTQGQWSKVMGTTPWKGQSLTADGDGVAASYISADDLNEFCDRLSALDGRRYRLPTEAEWEWACRAGTTTNYSFGDEVSRLGEYAWFDGNAWSKEEQYAHFVGQKPPNPFGLFDVHGNVWEWCLDSYEGDDSRNGKPTEPDNPSAGNGRVLRGGSWFNEQVQLRSSSRRNYTPSFRSSNIGGRVLVELL